MSGITKKVYLSASQNDNVATIIETSISNLLQKCQAEYLKEAQDLHEDGRVYDRNYWMLIFSSTIYMIKIVDINELMSLLVDSQMDEKIDNLLAMNGFLIILEKLHYTIEDARHRGYGIIIQICTFFNLYKKHKFECAKLMGKKMLETNLYDVSIH